VRKFVRIAVVSLIRDRVVEFRACYTFGSSLYPITTIHDGAPQFSWSVSELQDRNKGGLIPRVVQCMVSHPTTKEG
jgi:hypothetical protein